MSWSYRRSRGPLISTFFLFLLILNYLPVSAHTDATKPPASESRFDVVQQPRTQAKQLVSPPASGDPLQIALNYLHTNRFELKLTLDDLADIVVKDRYVSQNNGVTHLYLRQRLDGIELFNGDININVMPDGRILNLGNRFVSDLRSRVKQQQPGIDAIATLRSVAGQLNLAVTQPLVATSAARGVDQVTEVSSGGFSRASIPMRLIYQPLDGGHVKLAWNMQIQPINSSDWLDIRADAFTGKILSQVNWTKDAARATQLNSEQVAIESSVASPSLAPTSATYLVFSLPAESPLDGVQTSVTDPADATASPFGWHDTDGVTGPEFTVTRGNNAFAYADIAAPNGFDGSDVTTEGGASLSFTYTTDFSQPLAPNRNAAVTNLFYVTNRTHDLLYHFGFDEASGNFQANNYGHGGLASDYVLAEAQDFSGVNNANFTTPPDGALPRMQIYPGTVAPVLSVLTPITIAGTLLSYPARFGPQNYSVTGDVALADDGAGVSANDGCEALVNNVAGKIVLVDRGNCLFKGKVRNAELAGAIGVIVANDDLADLTAMRDDNSIPAVTIPSVLIGKSDGLTIKNALSDTVTVSLNGVQRDGAFDNNVIIHEYGHGLSTRLTGGPGNSNCLDAIESGGMGEGWSDFLALALTAKVTDTATTSMFVGRWLGGYSAVGPGFRHYPYTTDLNVNPQTFAYTDLSSEVHDVGEIWASMLWEVYWNLVNKHGFAPDLLDANSGNHLALQLVIDGMKLQPCSPTFVDARDAILAADLADTGGANQCQIWEGFAKRGLGYSADAGTSDDVQDGAEAFDLPSSCTVNVQPTILDVCAPDNAQFTVALGDSFQGAATLSVENLPAGATSLFSVNPITAPTTSTLTLGNTAVVTPDFYWIDVVGTGSSQIFTTTVEVDLASSTPNSVTLSIPADGETDVSDAPFFIWDPVPQASSYLFEVASDASFTTLIYTTTTYFSLADIPFYLRSARTYYWRVTAQNGCGSSVASAASFTVRTFPQLLFVDDDSQTGGYDLGWVYDDIFSTLGVSYDYWDTGNSGNSEPTSLDDIADYTTIIWFNGPYGAAPEPETEPILAAYLDEGKCLFINSQDYYYTRGLTPFMHDYLGVEAAVDDLSDGLSWQNVVTGTAPIFADLGPYTLAPWDGNYSDIITPTASAGVAFVGDAGNAAVYKDGGHFRTTYWGFEYENLPDQDAAIATISRVLDFCNFQTNLGIEQQVTPAGTMRPGQPLTYTLSFSNTGVTTATGVLITATLPSALTDLAVVNSGAIITQVATSPYQWQVEELAPTAGGLITVTGMVSPLLNSDQYLLFRSSIGGQNYDQNASNNSTTTLTRTLIVPRIQLLSNATNVAEGVGFVTMTVGLDQANPYADAEVLIGTQGTAQVGSDYGSLPTGIIVPAGQVAATLFLPITDDSEVEVTETLTVSLASPTGAALGNQKDKQLTLIDNDQPQVSFASGHYTTSEASAPYTITLLLDQPQPAHPVSITVQSSSGTATMDTDYVALSRTVTFAAGQNSADVAVEIKDDTAVEGDESILLTLSKLNGVVLGAPISSSLVITDDDLPLVRFASAIYTVSESSGLLTVTVMLDQPNPRANVLVNYQSADGSALAGSDYTSVSGTLSIPSGQQAATLLVPLISDQTVEPNKSFHLTLLAAQNGILSNPLAATVTITDDDQPQVSFASSSYTTTEVSGQVTMTLVLDQPNPRDDVEVHYQTLDGSALANSDYTPVSGTAKIPSGQQSVTIVVQLVDDSEVENTESFALQLGNVTNALIGTPTTTTVTIVDGDSLPPANPTITISANPPSGTTLYVGDEVQYTVTIQNNEVPANNIVVTATLPSNAAYVPGSSTPNPELATARSALAQPLVWKIPTLAANGNFTITFALDVTSASQSLQSAITVSVDGAARNVAHQVDHPVDESRRLFLPTISR
ncbi:MAG: M36 family metallopeptidase [Caldilineaceae bacterium]